MGAVCRFWHQVLPFAERCALQRTSQEKFTCAFWNNPSGRCFCPRHLCDARGRASARMYAASRSLRKAMAALPVELSKLNRQRKPPSCEVLKAARILVCLALRAEAGMQKWDNLRRELVHPKLAEELRKNLPTVHVVKECFDAKCRHVCCCCLPIRKKRVVDVCRFTMTSLRSEYMAWQRQMVDMFIAAESRVFSTSLPVLHHQGSFLEGDDTGDHQQSCRTRLLSDPLDMGRDTACAQKHCDTYPVIIEWVCAFTTCFAASSDWHDLRTAG